MINIYTIEILCITAGILTIRPLKVIFHVTFRALACNLIGLGLGLPEIFYMRFDKLFG